eukprot:7171973-Pyramimonas_sp.AAC.1
MYRRGAGRTTSDASREWVAGYWPVLRRDWVAEARSSIAEAGLASRGAGAGDAALYGTAVFEAGRFLFRSILTVAVYSPMIASWDKIR